MKQIVVALSVVLLLGADDKKDAKKTKLEGAWKAVSAVQDGNEQTGPEEHVLTFTGDTFTVARDGDVMMKGTFKVDASKKPATIDMDVKESKRERNKGKSIVGVYELDGDTLKWCAAEPGSTERPTDFTNEKGSKRLLVTLKREKK